jgi:hypothetical protein
MIPREVRTTSVSSSGVDGVSFLRLPFRRGAAETEVVVAFLFWSDLEVVGGLHVLENA